MANSKEQDFLIWDVIAWVVSYIGEDENVTTEKALEIFFSTELSKKIEVIETGYYWESPSYIYEIFKKERAASLEESDRT